MEKRGEKGGREGGAAESFALWKQGKPLSSDPRSAETEYNGARVLVLR